MTYTVQLSEPEAWLLSGVLQPTAGSETGRQTLRTLLLKLFSILNEFEERRGRPFPPSELPLALNEEECWLICHHTRPLTGDGRIGRMAQAVLLKVSRLLLMMQQSKAVDPLAWPVADRPAGDALQPEDIERLRRYLSDLQGPSPEID